MQQQGNPQNAVFKALDAVPGQVWYIAGIVSILISATLQLTGRKQLALFVGQWPPSFFAVGIYHKLVRPGSEDAVGQLGQAAQQAANAPQEVRDQLS